MLGPPRVRLIFELQPSVEGGNSPCNAGTTCLSNDTFKLSYAPLETGLVVCFFAGNPKRAGRTSLSGANLNDENDN